jgi:hypothetical protein
MHDNTRLALQGRRWMETKGSRKQHQQHKHIGITNCPPPTTTN